MTFEEFFQNVLRQPFFTGFLTLTGFLLSATTFIVIQMKKELYDKDQYLKEVARLRQIDSTTPIYKPLRSLSRLLVVALTLSLTTSLSQFTIGVWFGFYGAVICAVLAAATFIVVFICLWQMHLNLQQWFGYLEDEANHKLSGDSQASQSSSK